MSPSPAESRYLRYQFDNAAQLRRHCRLVDGRVIIFFPQPRPVLAERMRALLEICFSGSEQQVALPALVHARELSGTPGLWLELRALSVVAGLQSALASPRRKRRRLAMDFLAWVQRPDGPTLACPVLDLSEGGARLWGVPGAPPAADDQLIIRMPETRAVRARVAWARGREVGIEFARDARAVAASVYARAADQWASARLALHPSSCTCANGGEPRDPPPPIALHRAWGNP
jgi:hypothetical protein